MNEFLPLFPRPHCDLGTDVDAETRRGRSPTGTATFPVTNMPVTADLLGSNVINLPGWGGQFYGVTHSVFTSRPFTAGFAILVTQDV